jgi:hypothetical protein
MRSIPTPDWARKPKTKVGADAQPAVELFETRMVEVREFLQKEVEDFVNDPDQCFLNEDDGFPVKERLSGQYYLSDIRYQKVFCYERIQYQMWVMIRCLENQWIANQTDFDYLGLEAILILSDDSEVLEFDGFNTSSI